MNTDTYTPGRPAAVRAASDMNESSYVDWPAIAAGAVIATALSVLLIGFGAGLGLWLTSPYQGEGVSAAWVAIAAGIWLAWVMVTGFGAGGYVVGRMRRKAGDATADEVEARDGMHGLVVWGTGLLVGALLAVMGVGSLLSAGGTAVGKVADVATQGQIAAIIGRTLTSGDMAERDLDYLAQVIAANSDMDATQARARVGEVNAEIAQARADTLAAVEKARIAGIVFGFIAAATLLLGAIAAFFAAAAGGRHRDAGLGFDITALRR